MHKDILAFITIIILLAQLIGVKISNVVAIADLSLSSRSHFSDCHLGEWLEFKHKYAKVYANGHEENYRRSMFCKTKNHIELTNRFNSVNSPLFINGLADRTRDELQRLQMPKRIIKSDRFYQPIEQRHISEYIDLLSDDELPDHVNWAAYENIVGPIQDQGECGACWAFATIGLLESRQHEQNSSFDRVIPLSAQQLIDCDYRSRGCIGGNIIKAYNYIMKVGGVQRATDYPYKSADGKIDKCRFERDKIEPLTQNLGKLKALQLDGDEQLLKKVSASYGPIDVSIEANDPFIYAGEDIIYDANCVPYGRNHEVLLVGYGTNPQGADYWIIKNSYGDNWGRLGYGLMARNRNNNCNIASDPVILVDD